MEVARAGTAPSQSKSYPMKRNSTTKNELTLMPLQHKLHKPVTKWRSRLTPIYQPRHVPLRMIFSVLMLSK
eukprot:3073719-Amphidinium_carterae.1